METEYNVIPVTRYKIVRTSRDEWSVGGTETFGEFEVEAHAKQVANLMKQNEGLS
jgi:hypothetical protein